MGLNAHFTLTHSTLIYTSGHVRNLPYNLPFSDVVTGSIKCVRMTCTSLYDRLALSVVYSLKKTRGLQSPQQHSSPATITARCERRQAVTHYRTSLAEHTIQCLRGGGGGGGGVGGDILLSVLDLLRQKVVICYAAEISLPTAKHPG